MIELSHHSHINCTIRQLFLGEISPGDALLMACLIQPRSKLNVRVQKELGRLIHTILEDESRRGDSSHDQ